MIRRRNPRTLPVPPPSRQVLSVIDAAGLLGLGESTLREMVRSNRIPHSRLGKRILFRREILLKMIAERESR